MSIDREEALRKAEKLLRQGRLDSAIAEYVRVIEDQPRDWATANTLGDVYVRAGQLDRAAAQYARIADHFARDGILPKAAALYKKVVKIRPDDEAAQLQLAEVSARQGLLADAKSYFLAVAERRRARGDRQGADEIVVRLGTLDPADLDARRNAARVAAARGDRQGASAQLRELASDLSQRGRDAEAREILREVALIDPDDVETRQRLAQLAIGTGDLDTARHYLTQEAGQVGPNLFRTAAEIELRAGRLREAQQLLTQALAIDPASAESVHELASALLADHPDAAFVCVDVLSDAAGAVGDWTTAAELLHAYVRERPRYIPALMKLIEVCVDGGLETTMFAAQGQLADAHLAAGRAAEARLIAEELVAHEPGDPAHEERLRQALKRLGELEPAAIAPDPLGSQSGPPEAGQADVAVPASNLPTHAAPGLGDADPDLAALLAELEQLSDEEERAEASARARMSVRAAPPVEEAAAPLAGDEEPELDLTTALDDLTPTVVPVASGRDDDAAPGATERRTLDEVFDDLRQHAGRDAAVESAAEQLNLALAYRASGKVGEAIMALETAVRSPRHRFEAATQLGQMYRESGVMQKAIEWFERAAEAPAPTAEDGRALLYELADTLDGAGESARALAVFLELQADADDYRDVRARIKQLSRVLAGG